MLAKRDVLRLNRSALDLYRFRMNTSRAMLPYAILSEEEKKQQPCP